MTILLIIRDYYPETAVMVMLVVLGIARTIIPQ